MSEEINAKGEIFQQEEIVDSAKLSIEEEIV
jgi:hypothetical protein